MQYEIFFSYDMVENFDVIYNYISKKSKSWRIICDNVTVHNKLKEKGCNSNPWKILTNEDILKSKRIYQDAKNIQEEYLQIFNKIRLKDMEIFRGFDYSLLLQLFILTKAKIFLEEKQDTIFLFSSFNDIYFAFTRFFKELGYSNNGKIGFLKNHKIEYINLESFNETSRYKNEFTQKRVKDFSKALSGDKSIIKNLQSISKIGSTLLSYFISSFSYKLSQSSNRNDIDNILRKIDKKIASERDIISAFFLTTTREDVYLKPWYPVFNRFRKEDIDFIIVTSDFATSVVLSKEKIPFISLLNEIKIIQNELKNNEFGKAIKNQIIHTVTENSHILGLKELLNYFINQSLKAMSILIICEHILSQFKIRSTVALAAGEMLENISLQISKKHKIANFSLLPLIIPPNAILADWFHADKIFVAGKNGIDSLTSLGYDENKLIMTGNPLYDYTVKIDTKKSKSKLEKEVKIESSKKLVIVAMGEYHKNDEIWMSKLIKFCNKNNFEIIIKIHPKWKRATTDGLGINLTKIQMECQKQKFLISYDIDIMTVLSAADLVITDYSNVGLEAICLEKPLVTVNFVKENLDNIIKYHDYGASLYLENYPELEKSIIEILNSDLHHNSLKLGRQKFIEQFNFGNDGNAHKRIFDLLTQSSH